MLTLTIKYKNNHWKGIIKVIDWITEIKNKWEWQFYIHAVWWSWYWNATKWLNDKQTILSYENDEEYYKREKQKQKDYDNKISEWIANHSQLDFLNLLNN